MFGLMRSTEACLEELCETFGNQSRSAEVNGLSFFYGTF